MNKHARVYLVPIPIAEGINGTLSSQVLDVTSGLKHYFVENIRTARRFLRSIHPTIVIDDIQFSEIDKHNGPELGLLRKWLKEGHVVGIMSESGCPGIADPGAELIAVAQENGAEIIPLVGPNSLILALMASGLNGQSFCFNGYLPVKEPARSQRIKHLEQQSKKEMQTQLFIETPYRNNNMLDDLLKNCQNSTRLCIAQNITAPNASIKTKSMAEWKKNKPTLEKVPAVFLFLA
ncbi:SAM-dependent methyltransferase [Polluticoccus soli]|uniref:SAM-dependent methyltransferase n=1 Tax=Polluticoccus soli TaxID=3034150 RepID=UPI0023E222AE|nr:SAM-dependent methyltransferase [Flavipsychrobacter sp. JY13-12]